MPHNFFRQRACIEARDHGEPSGQEREAAKRNKWGPTKWGGRLCRIRVTLDRTAHRGLFTRGERPALGRVDIRGKIGRRYENLGFPFRKVGSRRFGLEPRKPGRGFAGWGFLLIL
jgi:hypothetical protein